MCGSNACLLHDIAANAYAVKVVLQPLSCQAASGLSVHAHSRRCVNTMQHALLHLGAEIGHLETTFGMLMQISLLAPKIFHLEALKLKF